ncbi:MAG: helix-turn-helix domain-containing protein [Clostridium sp.]
MNKTYKLKKLILDKYSSIREFSRVVDIPSTTLTSALEKDIGGMAVDRVIKICDCLNIDMKTFDPIIVNKKNSYILTEEEEIYINNLRKLNYIGRNKAIEYSEDLLNIPKYTKVNSQL